MAQYLLDQGADVESAKNDGWTPLHIAAEKGHMEVIIFMVSRGAQADQRVQPQLLCFLCVLAHLSRRSK